MLKLLEQASSQDKLNFLEVGRVEPCKLFLQQVQFLLGSCDLHSVLLGLDRQWCLKQWQLLCIEPACAIR